MQFMQIGIDGRSLQDQPWTGVGQYTYHLLRALFEMDRENEYVVWYNAAGKLDAPAFSEYPNVRVHRTRWPNKVMNVASKVSGVRCQVSGVDLFFMPNLNFISIPKHTKLILTIHDLSFVHFPEHYSWKSRLWHCAVNPRALLKHADRVIAVSEHTKGDLVETYGIRHDKISVIYPGVGSLRCHSRGGGNPQSQDSCGSPIPVGDDILGNVQEGYILYFGALEPRKNIAGVIEAFERLHLQFADWHEIDPPGHPERAQRVKDLLPQLHSMRSLVASRLLGMTAEQSICRLASDLCRILRNFILKFSSPRL